MKKRRIFYDLEFLDDGKTIDFLSIGMTTEDGRESYYAVSKDCNLRKANEWVKSNVIPQLPPRNVSPPSMGGPPGLWERSQAWKSKEQIAIEVMGFVKGIPTGVLLRGARSKSQIWIAERYGIAEFRYHPDPLIMDTFLARSEYDIELWANFAAYDHVALCQLFGAMNDLPVGFPFVTYDIQQYAAMVKAELPPIPKTEHHALADARWNRAAWLILENARRTQNGS